MCRKPYKKGVMNYGCGQCTPCRINKSREWVCRMQLERREHQHAAFVTLTYNDECLPPDGSVQKRDLQNFLKRLRQEVAPRQLRYYAVGEYGDKSWRPHYHLIVFGLSPTEGKTVEKCWPSGFIKMGTAESSSMGYVAGYVVKKMTNPKDKRLEGRKPEFALMSLRPGIGHGIVQRMVNSYNTESGMLMFDKGGWIAERLRVDQKKYHYGRYIKSKILDGLGIPPEIRKLHHVEVQCQVLERDAGKNTKEIERATKARWAAESGRIQAVRAKTKTL